MSQFDLLVTYRYGHDDLRPPTSWDGMKIPPYAPSISRQAHARQLIESLEVAVSGKSSWAWEETPAKVHCMIDLLDQLEPYMHGKVTGGWSKRGNKYGYEIKFQFGCDALNLLVQGGYKG